MIEMTADLWDFPEKGYHIVVPTNLVVKADGKAVMGRGVAKQAVLRFPSLAEWYGRLLSETGHTTTTFYPDTPLILFPVKYDWRLKADLQLIEQSAIELRRLTKKNHLRVALPLVGCGFGELTEVEVMPVLNRDLDDADFVLVRRSDEATKKHAATLTPGVRTDRTVKR
jgi:hypothetical protein